MGVAVPSLKLTYPIQLGSWGRCFFLSHWWNMFPGGYQLRFPYNSCRTSVMIVKLVQWRSRFGNRQTGSSWSTWKQPSKNEAYEIHINSQALYKLNEFDIYLLINVSLQYDYMIIQLCICVVYWVHPFYTIPSIPTIPTSLNMWNFQGRHPLWEGS